MVRALEKYFGATPDLDIEEQRAVVVLKRPMAIDWKVVEDLIKRANYTFGGAHLRTKGRIIEEVAGSGMKTLVFEFHGSGQKMEIKNPEQVRSSIGKTAQFAARVEDWKKGTPRLVVLSTP